MQMLLIKNRQMFRENPGFLRENAEIAGRSLEKS